MTQVLQIDQFASDFRAVREAVICSDFSTKRGPDGALYSGISQFEVPHWFDLLGKYLGKPITPKISAFRLNLAGELPHSWVHSDDICAQFATVLYMNTYEQCKGGTAFWRHKDLGIDRLPTRDALRSMGIDDEDFYQRIPEHWKQLELWEQTELISMYPNRLITYPTSLFHSRYPFEGFGTGPADGRLIWICFYDLGDS